MSFFSKEMETFRCLWKWLIAHLTRKPTVLFHIIAGLLSSLLSPWFPLPATTGFILFGVFEWWQAEVEGDMGHLDFWDGLLGYFIGLGVLGILLLTGFF